jgi:carbon storage regulator CsrA
MLIHPVRCSLAVARFISQERIPMLVLSRRRGESIILTLPDESRVAIRILECEQGRAKLGVTAAGSVTIHRDEIQRQVDHAREAARAERNERLHSPI